MPMPDPAPGDHLVSKRGIYTHHGISAGGGTVVHYAGLSNGWQRGRVEEVPVAAFAAGQGFRTVPHARRRYSRDESVRRARARLGEDYYCFVANNCEHFVRYCIDGDHSSSQVMAGSQAAYAVLIGLGGVAAVVAVAGTGVAAGLSGPAIMAHLAGIGAWAGGGALTGLAILSAVPGILWAELVNYTLLRGNAGLEFGERNARLVGRIAARAGAVGGTAACIAAVGAVGTVGGFSAAGLASGLAAIGAATGAGPALSAMGVGGGLLAVGVAVMVAAPVVAALVAGWAGYKAVRWVRQQRAIGSTHMQFAIDAQGRPAIPAAAAAGTLSRQVSRQGVTLTAFPMGGEAAFRPPTPAKRPRKASTGLLG